MSISRTVFRSSALACVAAGAVVAGAAPVASAAPPAPGSTESVFITPWLRSGPRAGETGTVQLPGKPRLELAMELRDSGTYSDVHFATSQPGSATRCADMPRLTRDRQITCTLDVKPLLPGETRTYTVTMTGKRNGVPFRRTSSQQLVAAPVSARVFVNGVETTGTTAALRSDRPSTVRYEITNSSTMPLRNLSYFTGDMVMGDKCHIAAIEPGKTGACTFTLAVDDPTTAGTEFGAQRFPTLTLDGAEGYRGWLDLNPGQYVFVK